MATTRQANMRIGTGRHSGRRKGNIERIIVVERGNNKEQEVTVHHKSVLPKKVSSVWSWHEEFEAEWSEIFIHKK